MRHPAPLPPHLRGTAFRTAGSGLGDRRLRAPDLLHPFRGVATHGVSLDSLRGRCEAYALRLRDGHVFSHTTALRLWGAPVPRTRERELHVSVAFPRTPPRTGGVLGHSLRRLEPVARLGLPVSGPAAAWCESAALLPVDALIAAGDALVTGPRSHGVRAEPACTLDDLRAAVLARRRMPGGERARRALPWIRSGVDSAAETALRLLLVRNGMPEPDVDVPVLTAIGVLHADMGYPAARAVIEYEGDGHRTDRAQWMHDIRRRELMEDAGQRVMRVVADDLRHPGSLLVRVERLLTRRS